MVAFLAAQMCFGQSIVHTFLIEPGRCPNT
jgi:hypothetical protein